MTMGARAIVENADGKVLLVRHTYTKGLYLPGGGVEHGETVQDTMRKELREEAGLELAEPAQQGRVYSNHRIMRNDHVVLFRVSAKSWTQTGTPNGREIAEIIWCDPLAPPEDATPATKRRLAEAFNNAEISDYW
jgi:ADP-ribose pyrophosphatase YjhB (NUDIX family)